MFTHKVPNLLDKIFSTVLEVRIYDINYGHHLGHDSLVSLLHEARMRFLTKNGYSEMNIHGLGILVTNLYVNYLAESFYGNQLTIHIGINKISRTSIDFLYEVIDNSTLKSIARALTTITFYDYQHQKIAKIPEEFLRKFVS